MKIKKLFTYLSYLITNIIKPIRDKFRLPFTSWADPTKNSDKNKLRIAGSPVNIVDNLSKFTLTAILVIPFFLLLL